LAELPLLPDGSGVLADRQRLVQVLLNLLSNAIKYNRPGGEVRIEVIVQAPHVSIAISDTGHGIAPELLGRLFKPFERLGADPQVEGTGLGLSLSKSLLEMMQGHLQVRSDPGQGCCFTLQLPCAHVSGSHLPPMVALEVARPRTEFDAKVLCIEDNLSSLALIETLMQRRPGIQLLSSMQGQMGLDLARQHTPQLILLDVTLPDLEGLEVLRRLRQSPATASTPVLMITADASDLAHRALRDAGATAILTKPIHIQAFLGHLERYLPESA
jgi:CheY-like chemotaxis protein